MLSLNKYNMLLLGIETQIKEINKKTKNWDHIYKKNSTLNNELLKRIQEIEEIKKEFDLYFNIYLQNETKKKNDYKIILEYILPF